MSKLADDSPNIEENVYSGIKELFDYIKGSKTKIEALRKSSYPLLFSLAFFAALLAFFSYVANSYDWQFSSIMPHLVSYGEEGLVFGLLVKALGVTISLICVSLVLALILAIGLAAMSLSASPVALLISRSIIGLVRNTPLLMQLFLIYFVISPLFSLSPFFSACLALALFEGTYLSEIFRAGFQSIAHTQWEAGFSLGFNTLETGRIVVLPQAIHNILPSLTGQIVSLIKDTSLVSAISVADITLRATELVALTFLSFEVWVIVALFYLLLTSLVSIPLSLYAKHVYKIYGKKINT